MSDTLQDGFDNLYRKARELCIMLGQFSERTLTEKLGTPVTVLPLAVTVGLERKWATEPQLPEETIDGWTHDIGGFVAEEARAQQRREWLEDLIERATERRDHFYGIGDIPRGDTFVLILIWLESERDAITGVDAGTEAQ